MKEVLVIGWVGVVFSVVWAGLMAYTASHGAGLQPWAFIPLFYTWMFVVSYPFLLPFGLKKIGGIEHKGKYYLFLSVMMVSLFSGRDIVLNLGVLDNGSGASNYLAGITTLCSALSYPFLLTAFIRHNLKPVIVKA